MSEPVIQVTGDQAFSILKECYADQAIELRLVRAQLIQANNKIIELTPKEVKDVPGNQ